MNATKTAIILRDGIAVAATENVLAEMHRIQPFSCDYAFEHGGYSVLESDSDYHSTLVRGWVAFLKAAKSDTGWNGIGARMVQDIDRVVNTADQDYYSGDVIIRPMLRALVAMMDYWDGDIEIIRGEVSQWTFDIAKRIDIADKNGEF